MHASFSIEGFVEAYEKTRAAENFSELVSLFADTFIAAGPMGARAIRARDLALALPARKQLFQRLGCVSTALVDVQPMRLDERFVQVRAQWRMQFHPGHGDLHEILADSTFIVDSADGEGKIIFYLDHQDIAAILKQRGFDPA